MITVAAIHKQFGDIKAVDGVTFSVASGETFGLLGPNGAGKTTTVSMLVGVLSPDSGEISIEGVVDPTKTSIRRQIGNAPQSLAVYEELTARENLEFFGRLYGIRGKSLEERVQWALELAGLLDRQKDLPKTFSGGMKRRLNLACALVHDPSILVLDEPTVGVDPQSRNLIFEKIELLKSQGRTIIYTTHYMEEAERLCDRVAIIDHGRLLDLDTVDNLINKHGGAARVEIEIDGNIPEGLSLPAAPTEKHLSFVSDSPSAEIARLASAGLAFASLHVVRPDLERVFLNLTGRQLRD